MTLDPKQIREIAGDIWWEAQQCQDPATTGDMDVILSAAFQIIDLCVLADSVPPVKRPNLHLAGKVLPFRGASLRTDHHTAQDAL